MNMSIIFSGEVFVTIDGIEHKVDQLFGDPSDTSDETFERWIRMNVHFWMGRMGFNDDAPGGELLSTICSYEVEYH